MSQEPKNLMYLRRWVRENRPDAAASLEDVLSKAMAYQNGAIQDPTGHSMLLMALFGVEAGRLWEREEPRPKLEDELTS